MKLVLVLALCGLAVAAPNLPIPVSPELSALVQNTSQEGQRNWLDPIMPMLFELLRGVIVNGFPAVGIPVLDPLKIEEFNVVIPSGIINLNLDLEKINAAGLSGFKIHTGRLNLLELSFDLDVTLPTLDISAEHYDFIGDLLTAVPLYGRGNAVFKVDGLRFKGKFYLGQSANGKSLIIKGLRNVGFDIRNFKSELTGAIGGGDIDHVVNAMFSEVVIDYVNRFQGYISSTVTKALLDVVNPILERFETWDLIGGIINQA